MESKWQKYQKKTNSNIERTERYEYQLKHTMEVWLSNKNLSILEIARMVRCLAINLDLQMDFPNSINVAKRLSGGRHQ